MSKPICLNCKHIYLLEPTMTNDKMIPIWHQCYCNHPDVGPKEKYDPVTGETSEDLPYCREINDGSCALFEEVADGYNAATKHKRILNIIKKFFKLFT